MDDFIVISVVILIFIFFPISGFYLIIRDFVLSKRRSENLQTFTDRIKKTIDLLRYDSLTNFDAQLSYILERYYPNVEWARTGTRLLVQAKVIALGEEHRNILVEDEDYRLHSFFHMRHIIDAIDQGDPENMYQEIGEFLALLYCDERVREYSSLPRNLNAKEETINTLQECALLSTTEIYQAEEAINHSLHRISKRAKQEEAGIPLLLLQWALIQLDEGTKIRNRTSKRIIGQRSPNLWQQFRIISERYDREDFKGVMEVLDASFRPR